MSKIDNHGSRFILVGVINTALDFGILNFLNLFGINPIIANTVSTALSMLFSFFANKKFTFKSNSKNYAKEVTLFFIFTLIGLWVIQNGIIWLIVQFSPSTWPEVIILNGAKLIATGASMTWNFFTYKHFVFKNED